ncbi:MAG: hypothetical protein BWX81_00989 [Spirochaetes bacterium ADurb.Bin110]|nr:MAG: hypothetical protein BWX81_00989 [Spirochaetes bacterium ADurb.Bin110]
MLEYYYGNYISIILLPLLDNHETSTFRQNHHFIRIIVNFLDYELDFEIA